MVMRMQQSNHNKTIRNWLFFNAFMVFCMAVIGAVTRLTESGLSIVEWQPITGAVPPLNEAEWNRVFALYQQTPEYQKINMGMSLPEFKNIFFWEWLHRLWGRLIGLVYALPLFYFWVRNRIPKGYKAPLLGLLFLGGLQGVVGYIMVLSGLVDRPSVSHYRLALHLSLAWTVFCALLWTGFNLVPPKTKETSFCRRRHGWTSLALLFITIIWGAFMAGTDAGLVSSTWPHLHAGIWLPDGSFSLAALVANEEFIHFTHRWLAAFTMAAILVFAWRVRSPMLGGIVILQFLLGITTVLTHVHIHVAATHQAGAFVLTAVLLAELHKLHHKNKDKPGVEKTV